MKRSIKRRIAFTFIILMVVTLVAVNLLQWLFLERYYFDRKQETLVAVSYTHLDVYKRQPLSRRRKHAAVTASGIRNMAAHP